MRLGSNSTPPPAARFTRTSSLWKRNSLGRRTAWPLPCRNTFAVFIVGSRRMESRYVEYAPGSASCAARRHRPAPGSREPPPRADLQMCHRQSPGNHRRPVALDIRRDARSVSRHQDLRGLRRRLWVHNECRKGTRKSPTRLAEAATAPQCCGCVAVSLRDR